MAKILVSGGAGFVGRHLIHGLLKENADHEIWVVDDFSTGLAPEKWELFAAQETGSVAGAKAYRFKGFTHRPFALIAANFAAVLGAEMGFFPSTGLAALPNFDESYHLASIVGGRMMIEGKPLLVGMDLAIDSLFFLWAATAGKSGRIMYASSSAAYPILQQQSDGFSYLTEDMIDFEKGVLAPDLTYGWSKLTGEYLGRIAVDKHKLSVGVVRPFSGYGEDQDPSYPTPAIALRAAAQQNPITVWGDGNQGRDFVHIADCIDGLIMTCRGISDGSAVNLGTGVLTSFRELASLMMRLSGYEGEVRGTANRPVGVAKRVSGGSRAQQVLGWKAKISNEHGMRRVVEHAKWRLAHGYRPPE